MRFGNAGTLTNSEVFETRISCPNFPESASAFCHASWPSNVSSELACIELLSTPSSVVIGEVPVRVPRTILWLSDADFDVVGLPFAVLRCPASTSHAVLQIRFFVLCLIDGVLGCSGKSVLNGAMSLETPLLEPMQMASFPCFTFRISSGWPARLSALCTGFGRRLHINTESWIFFGTLLLRSSPADSRCA